MIYLTPHQRWLKNINGRKEEMTDELYEATKKEVMTEEEEYRNADVPMPKNKN